MMRRLSVWALACLAWLALGGRVQAQQPAEPSVVDLRIGGLFGTEIGVSDAYTPLLVRATNRSRTTLQGDVIVTVRSWDATQSMHRVRLDIPAGETRQVVLSLPSFNGGNIFHAEYVAGESLGSAEMSLSANATSSIVLMDDPPRLRGALAGLEAPDQYGTARPIPIGQVSTDTRSGDPFLPRDAAGWSSVQLVVATISALEHAGEVELRALESWLHAGGHLLLIPTREQDLVHPFVRRVLGALARNADGSLACAAPAQTERVGCRARLGFGTVWISNVDLTEPARLVESSTRDTIRELVDRANYEPHRQAMQTFRTTPTPVTGLDPNQGYRPALLFVGLVFFVYVVLVGPVNFTWVQRRKQPTLALITTPILAFLCALVVFAVGYLGKGVVMRFRRVEIVEAHEGSAFGTMSRNVGFFYTRPASSTLTLDEGIVAVRYNASASSGPMTEEGGPSRRLEGMRAGLWETAFVREEGVRDLGGGIHFILDGTRIAQVRNDSTFALHDAFISDVSGNLYRVGEVAPGATAPVPTNADSYLAPGAALANTVYDPSAQAFLGMLGFDSQALGPVTTMFTGEVISYEVPVLYARLDPDSPPNISPSFERDLDLRLLRIVPDELQAIVRPAPANATEAPSSGDAGVTDAGMPDAGVSP